MACGLLLVAGGSGSRMQSALPKQFLEIEGKPILLHTLEAFLNIGFLPQDIRIVLPLEFCNLGKSLFPNIKIIAGGNTRSQSVMNGLHSLDETYSHIAIHDGVRPFVSIELWNDLKNSYLNNPNNGILPVVDLKDSIRQFQSEGKSIPVDRSNYCLVQTPQVFPLSELKECYRLMPENQNFTDDASLWEFFKKPVKTTKGSDLNFKITTPVDLLLAKALLGGAAKN